MFEQELTDQDVMSVLNQMQLEVTQKLNEQRTLKYIGGVVTFYRKAKAELADMERAKAELQRASEALQGRHDSILAGHQREQRESRQAADTELASIKEKLAAGRQTLADLDAEVKEKELFTQRRLAQMDKDIADRQAALDRVQQAFDTFTQQHGLAKAQ